MFKDIRDYLRRRFQNRVKREVRAEATPDYLLRAKPVGPDFICIGAQKSGTRWLYDQLQFHEDFWMPVIKELHYFNSSIQVKFAAPLYDSARRNLARRNAKRAVAEVRQMTPEDVDWLRALIWLHRRDQDFDTYAKLFSPKGDLISGDITPSYAILPDAEAKAIRERFPETKIVYMARDPVERFWSHYCMIVRHKSIKNPERFEEVEAFLTTGSGRRHSRATEVVKRWRLSPDDPNFRLYFFDDLITRPVELRDDIIRFVGGDPAKPSGTFPANFNRKSAATKVPMSNEIRERLIAAFTRELYAAAKQLGGPAERWPAKYGL